MIESTPKIVYDNLTDSQRAQIIAKVTAINPHWRGATCEDILDTLANHDSNIETIEPFVEAHPEIGSGDAVTVALLALIWSDKRVTADNVVSLIHPRAAGVA